MGFKLRVRNFRALRSVDLELSGVMCVVGANGAGKTTLLFVLNFLKLYLVRGLADAVKSVGYTELKNRQADPSESIELSISAGCCEWIVRFDTTGRETVIDLDEVRIDGAIASFGAKTMSGRQMIRQLTGLDGNGTIDLAAFSLTMEKETDVLFVTHLLPSNLIHFDPNLRALRDHGSQSSDSEDLRTRSENTFAVLRRWHERKPERFRFDFVRDGLRLAFPALVDDLDFEVAADTVFLRVWRVGEEVPRAIRYESNGLLSLLCTLTAIGASHGSSVVAIDEPENGLHPFAIRRLVEHTRRWSANHDVTVLFTTHSPVLLNQFREEPEQIIVFEAGQAMGPTSLDKIRDRDWLEGLLPGDLYQNLEYGSPVIPTEE